MWNGPFYLLGEKPRKLGQKLFYSSTVQKHSLKKYKTEIFRLSYFFEKKNTSINVQ